MVEFTVIQDGHVSHVSKIIFQSFHVFVLIGCVSSVGSVFALYASSPKIDLCIRHILLLKVVLFADLGNLLVQVVMCWQKIGRLILINCMQEPCQGTVRLNN